MADESEERTLTAKELSERIGVPIRTVFSWIEQGKLPAGVPGKRGSSAKASRLRAADVAAFFEAEQRKAAERGAWWQELARRLDGES